MIEKAMTIPGATTEQHLNFLYELAITAPQEPMVELGSYLGRSLSVLSHAAKKVGTQLISIDNYTPEDWAPETRTLADIRANLKKVDAWGKHVRLIRGESTDTHRIESVGFLFVDSTHTEEHFGAEMKAWLPLLVPEGIIVCHDWDSPRWTEMNNAIRGWLFRKPYDLIGIRGHIIAFRRN